VNVPFGIIVALIGGLAVGIERQWSGHASGPRARFAGIRTFALLGGFAGLSGWLWSQQVQLLAAVLVAAAAALIVAAYVAASATDVEATTEVSALVVVAAGVIAGLGHLALSSGITAATCFFLLEKSRLHALVHRIDDESLRAAARFAVMAAVVLPLLPSGPYPPWDTVRPRTLWLLVLFFSGLSFISFIARRGIGARYGYTLAGILGGFVSSTSVTLTFARASRNLAGARVPLAYGAIAASTVLFARVAVAALVLNPSLAAAALWYLLPPFALGVLIVLTGLRQTSASNAIEPPDNPLQIGAALQMAALFQVVLILVELARRTWGNVGVIVSSAVLGLTDVDALTLSMANAASSQVPVDVAARGLAIGILSNTVLKALLALVVGSERFKWVTSGGLLVLGAGLGVALVLLW
jgi:uncharacterized membrane protein (DUF4010 family)